ncbi:endolytic transglycosylase MltG [Streptomyces jumonjinensis]|uniref:endolytic transglycosylase MltG n=1 Tax=Streptomyces jumonjinensis TaxID=1945 RepID=UPI00379CDF14
MTEYGRSPGSAPWHPEDPLHGDQGWTGQQDPAGHAAPYGAQQPEQSQQQPDQLYGGYQEPYQQQYGDQQYDGGVPGHAGQPYDGSSYGEQQYGAAHQHAGPDQQYAGQQQYPEQQAPQQYPEQQAPQQYPGQQQPTPSYGDQQYAEHQYAAGGWDAVQQTGMPYDPAQADPYAGHTPDLYGTQDAYPPPEPPGRRSPQVPEAEPERQPEREEEPNPLLSGDDGHGDELEQAGSRRGGGGRDGRGGRSKKQKKGRNGVACLIVAVVLAGGLGGVGYFGYQFWQGRFGTAPDYTGEGSGSVQVEIPQGSVGSAIGQLLEKAGVVKSTGAFVSAQGSHPDGQKIQAGVYTLRKGMSAANALKMMLNPSSHNSLIIPEGKRNVWVYEQIDDHLRLESGTTEKVAEEKAESLGLPKWAMGHPEVKDPLEGFLFPASYPIARSSKPEDVLRKMIDRAKSEYDRIDPVAQAKKLNLEGPWQLITVASLVQAEGKTDDDFRKMSEVIYNRLKPNNTETMRKIQFDSAFNYLMGKSKIKISETEINSNPDPYNTYVHAGLPPGPIGNPGMEALEAAINPTDEGWIYFVATDGMNKTEFARDLDEHNRLKEKFNESGVE